MSVHKGSKFLKAVVTSLAACMVGFSLGCSESEFSSQVENSSVTPPPTSSNNVVTLSFDREINTTTDIDMVWVIDNSTSMVEELQIIRENLGRFLLSLEDRSKLNFTLITNSRGSYGMALSSWALDRGYRQFSQLINSYDSLTQFLNHLPRMQGSAIRAGSQKILVVVSDDNSEVTANEFFRLIPRHIDPNDLKVFGFVGLDKTASPCIDKAGGHYVSLAQATGGQAFNICERDWTPYFESLVKNVAEITKTEFQLPNTQKTNLKVFIDGVATSKFKLERNTLVINPENFKLNKKYKITVSYSVKK